MLREEWPLACVQPPRRPSETGSTLHSGRWPMGHLEGQATRGHGSQLRVGELAAQTLAVRPWVLLPFRWAGTAPVLSQVTGEGRWAWEGAGVEKELEAATLLRSRQRPLGGQLREGRRMGSSGAKLAERCLPATL